MGSVCLMPILGDRPHSHACRGHSSIHYSDSSAEGRQRTRVMEPDAWLSVWG